MEIEDIIKNAKKENTVCSDVIEKFEFDNDDVLKEFFCILLLGDLTAGLGLTEYEFWPVEKKSHALLVLEKQASFYCIVKSAAEQFIRRKYKLSDKNFEYLLQKYNNQYYTLHTFMFNLTRLFVSSYTSYTIVNERPHLFKGSEHPPFSNRDVSIFKSCRNLPDFKKFIEMRISRKDLSTNKRKVKRNIETKQKKESDYDCEEIYDDLDKEVLNYMDMRNNLQENERDAVLNIAKYFQKNLSSKTMDGGEKRRQKVKSTFFRENNFLDGYEDELKRLELKKDSAYNKLDDWATNFNKY